MFLMLNLQWRDMGAPDVADVDDVIFEKADVGSVIKAASFPSLVQISLNDFGEQQKELWE